jgi:hypothetical protein
LRSGDDQLESGTDPVSRGLDSSRPIRTFEVAVSFLLLARPLSAFYHQSPTQLYAIPLAFIHALSCILRHQHLAMNQVPSRTNQPRDLFRAEYGRQLLGRLGKGISSRRQGRRRSLDEEKPRGRTKALDSIMRQLPIAKQKHLALANVAWTGWAAKSRVVSPGRVPTWIVNAWPSESARRSQILGTS